MRKKLRRWVVNPSPTLRITLLLSAVVSYGTTGFLYFELPARPDLKPLDGLWWSLVTPPSATATTSPSQPGGGSPSRYR